MSLPKAYLQPFSGVMVNGTVLCENNKAQIPEPDVII